MAAIEKKLKAMQKKRWTGRPQPAIVMKWPKPSNFRREFRKVVNEFRALEVLGLMGKKAEMKAQLIHLTPSVKKLVRGLVESKRVGLEDVGFVITALWGLRKAGGITEREYRSAMKALADRVGESGWQRLRMVFFGEAAPAHLSPPFTPMLKVRLPPSRLEVREVKWVKGAGEWQPRITSKLSKNINRALRLVHGSANMAEWRKNAYGVIYWAHKMLEVLLKTDRVSEKFRDQYIVDLAQAHYIFNRALELGLMPKQTVEEYHTAIKKKAGRFYNEVKVISDLLSAATRSYEKSLGTSIAE